MIVIRTSIVVVPVFSSLKQNQIHTIQKYLFLQGSINFINNLIWTTNKIEA